MERLIKIVLVALIIFGYNVVLSQEICDNGIDDDANGLIDLNDVVACPCSLSSGENYISNHSFENYTSFPYDYGQLNKAQDWDQLSNGTSDYFYYPSGWSSGYSELFSSPLDGNGCVGFFNNNNSNDKDKEYVGTCLAQPLLAGETYYFSFDIGFGDGSSPTNMASPPTNIALFGEIDCDSLTMTENPWRDCPANHDDWVLLGEVAVSGTPKTWDTYTFSITPTVDIFAIAVGPDCSPATARESYYFLDNLYINKLEITSSCQKVLQAVTEIPGTFQWYQDGIALVGEISDKLNLNKLNYPSGRYTVHLILPNGNCLYNFYDYTGTLISNFTSNDPICQNEILNLTDASTAPISNITTYKWDLGDGSTYTSQNVSHQYASSGTFDVSLVVENDQGCTDTNTIQILINQSPVALINATDVCFPDNSIISDGSTINPPESIINWDWDFGNGDVANGVQNPNYNYTSPGSYSISLTVTASNNCQSSITLPYSVNTPPIADFTDGIICTNDPFIFQNNSTFPQSNLQSVLWDFGDGNTSTNTDPSHIFTVPGIYDVVLTVYSAEGCEHSITKQIEALPAPTADFSGPENPLALTDSAFFNNLSSNYTNLEWNFGDGNTNKIDVDPSHLYQSRGTFNVILIVDDGVCSDTAMQPVTIFSELIAYIPNAFSPNDDGLNDTFIPITNASVDDFVTLQIFNKWGELIYQSSDLNKGWNGNYKGKEVQNDVYLWTLIYAQDNGDTKDLKGKVSVIR